MPGKGPTWLTSLIAAARRDRPGAAVRVVRQGRTAAQGVRPRAGGLGRRRRSASRRSRDVDDGPPAFPTGHAVRHGRATSTSPTRSRWSACRQRPRRSPTRRSTRRYTCLKDGPTLDDPGARPRRRTAVCATPGSRTRRPVGPAEQAKLVKAGKMKPAESPVPPVRPRHGQGGRTPTRGSVAWNEYRKRWTMLFVEQSAASRRPRGGLVRRGRRADRPVAVRGQGGHARPDELLQPEAAPVCSPRTAGSRSTSRGRTRTTSPATPMRRRGTTTTR